MAFGRKAEDERKTKDSERTKKMRINAEMYATDNVWSEVPLNGAAPVILMITAVAVKNS